MNEPLVLTFVNEAYLPVGLNWVRQVQKVRPQANIKVIAIDQPTATAFEEDLVLYRPLESDDLGDLWIHRILVFQELLADGHDLIHSDSDAIWVRDPVDYVLATEKEMVFSQGTIWPPDVHAKHQVVLCCGFFYLKSVDSVIEFIRDVGSRVQDDKDDQVSVNRLISERGVNWQFDSEYEIEFKDKTFRASRQPVSSGSGNLPSLCVLPHHRFPRLYSGMTPETMVAHPLIPKSCEAKIEALTNMGLWQCSQ